MCLSLQSSSHELNFGSQCMFAYSIFFLAVTLFLGPNILMTPAIRELSCTYKYHFKIKSIKMYLVQNYIVKKMTGASYWEACNWERLLFTYREVTPKKFVVSDAIPTGTVILVRTVVRPAPRYISLLNPIDSPVGKMCFSLHPQNNKGAIYPISKRCCLHSGLWKILEGLDASPWIPNCV